MVRVRFLLFTESYEDRNVREEVIHQAGLGGNQIMMRFHGGFRPDSD